MEDKSKTKKAVLVSLCDTRPFEEKISELKEFFKDKPDSRSHDFHIIIQLIALEYKIHPDITHHFKDEWHPYYPPILAYLRLYNELHAKYPDEACLCSRFCELIVQRTRDFDFKIAVLKKHEDSAIHLLEKGANPNQTISHTRVCHHPENTLSQSTDIIPLIRLTKSMPRLHAKMLEHLETH